MPAFRAALAPASDPLAVILQAVNLANPALLSPLTESNVTASVPAAMPVPTTSGINTSLVLTGVTGSGYTGSATVYYPRLDLGARFPTGMTAVGDGVTTWAALATALNAAHGTFLSANDLPTTPLVIQTLPTTLAVTIAPGSFLYTGTVTVSLSSTAPSLASAVTVTALAGLTAPG